MIFSDSLISGVEVVYSPLEKIRSTPVDSLQIPPIKKFPRTYVPPRALEIPCVAQGVEIHSVCFTLRFACCNEDEIKCPCLNVMEL